MRTVTFKAIDGNYKISDLIVTGAVGAGADAAQKINADGTWGDTYYYYTMAGSYWLEDGWYKDGAGTPVTDADVLKVGEALIFSASSDITLTCNGEVINGTPSINVPAGSSIVGNPLPLTVKVSAIKVDGAVGAGGDAAQKINADGTWGDTYYYYTMAGSYWLEDGWYKDGAGTVVTDADVLEPGEGLIFSSSSGMTLTFPSAL